MADIFNNYFKKKITLLRQKTATAAEIEPATRLRDWLSKRAQPPPEFKIRKITLPSDFGSRLCYFLPLVLFCWLTFMF